VECSDVAANLNIETGSARPLNLCAPPFNFPPALDLIDDYARGLVPYQLSLWREDSLRDAASINDLIVPAGNKTL